MDGLPEQQRLALEWKYVDKLSVRSIADRMDVTEKAAESILFRARREFRDRMLRIDKEDPPPAGSNPGEPEKKMGDSQTETRPKVAKATV